LDRENATLKKWTWRGALPGVSVARRETGGESYMGRPYWMVSFGLDRVTAIRLTHYEGTTVDVYFGVRLASYGKRLVEDPLPARRLPRNSLHSGLLYCLGVPTLYLSSGHMNIHISHGIFAVQYGVLLAPFEDGRD